MTAKLKVALWQDEKELAEYPLRAVSREDIAAGVNEGTHAVVAMTLPHVIIGEKGVSLPG